MTILNKKRIQEIYDTITYSKIFTIDDFKIEFPDKGNTLAKIHFKASGKYTFLIIENDGLNIFNMPLLNNNHKKEISFQTIEKPSDNKNEEKLEHENLDKCIERIYYWLQNLDVDLKIINNQDNEETNKEFEDRLNELFPDENERFSQDEIKELREKIEILQEKIVTLEQNESSKKVFEIFEHSKKDIEIYPKKTWYLKTYNRLRQIKDSTSLVISLRNNLQEIFGYINDILNKL